MLAIRFNRTGKRNHASFRVVLQEHTKAPGKRHVEILGSYDPHKKTTILKKERILYWISQGAQTSPVVTNLLVREGVIQGKKVAKKMPRPVVKEPAAALAMADKPVVEVPEAKVEEALAPATEEVKMEETSAPVAEEAKTVEVSAPVAPEVKTEEVSAPAEVPEIKAEEVIPVAEVVAESTPVIAEEVSATVEATPKA
ncbi:MAG: 30S ribosomal protein S16, partial [bacterium]|nr:30S ribosomal protein S16 [bacterium]